MSREYEHVLTRLRVLENVVREAKAYLVAPAEAETGRRYRLERAIADAEEVR